MSNVSSGAQLEDSDDDSYGNIVDGSTDDEPEADFYAKETNEVVSIGDSDSEDAIEEDDDFEFILPARAEVRTLLARTRRTSQAFGTITVQV